MRIQKTYLFFICLFAFAAMAFTLVNESKSEVEALYLNRVLELEKALLDIDHYLSSNQLNDRIMFEVSSFFILTQACPAQK